MRPASCCCDTFCVGGTAEAPGFFRDARARWGSVVGALVYSTDVTTPPILLHLPLGTFLLLTQSLRRTHLSAPCARTVSACLPCHTCPATCRLCNNISTDHACPGKCTCFVFTRNSNTSTSGGNGLGTCFRRASCTPSQCASNPRTSTSTSINEAAKPCPTPPTPPPPAPAPKRNVLYVVYDDLRPDLSAYDVRNPAPRQRNTATPQQHMHCTMHCTAVPSHRADRTAT